MEHVYELRDVMVWKLRLFILFRDTLRAWALMNVASFIAAIYFHCGALNVTPVAI